MGSGGERGEEASVGEGRGERLQGAGEVESFVFLFALLLDLRNPDVSA